MIACEQCGKSNSLDSLFCRACGVAIADALIIEARASNEVLIQEGYKLLSDNRQEEAQMIAETALRDDPSSMTALTLLGDCYEQAGRLADALDCYERLLEQSPNSTLDRIKISHLRKRLAAQAAPKESLSRRIAFLGALAAVTLVGSIGAALALSQGSGTDVKSNTGSKVLIDDAGTSVEGFGLTSNSEPTDSNRSDGTKANETQGNAETPLREPERNDQNRSNPPPLARSGSGRALPDVRANGGLEPVGPLNPFPSINVVPEGLTAQKPKTNEGDVDPSVEKRGGNVASNSTNQSSGETGKPTPVEDSGIIEIRGAGSPSTVRGGGEVLPDSNQSEALVRSGKNDLQIGDHGRAASAFEKALSAGAPAGSTNQNLGRAYERMGKPSEAIAAYRRSIAAYERDLASGKGDPARLRAAIASCKQAIRVLQGK